MRVPTEGEIAHILQSCQVLTKEGEIETLVSQGLGFGYRHSAIQDSGPLSCQLNLP